MKKQYQFLMFFCSFFMLTNGLLKAQGNDFIINNSGEKVFGEILRSFDFNNSETIKFRQGSNAEKVYSPYDVEGFGLENGRYFLSLDLPEVKERVFAQVIFSGKLTLISHKSKYFVDTGGEILELKPSYTLTDESGRRVKSNSIKPYLGILNMLMSGYCGREMQSSIFGTGYNERDLISTFRKYHSCEGLAYQIHVEKIPSMKFSPVVGLGFNFLNKANSFSSIGRKDVFEDNLFPMVQAGIKLHQFRKAPRFSFDASVGFTSQNNTINSEYINAGVDMTGTETYKLSSFYAPVFLSYSLLRLGNSETYLGIGGTFRVNNLESNFAIIDANYDNRNVTRVYERSFVAIEDRLFSPSAKIGTDFKSKSKIGFISELQVDYLQKAFSIGLFEHVASYDHIMFSFLIGVRF